MTPVFFFRSIELETTAGALESMQCLGQAPLDYAQVVVAVAEDVVAGRETMLGAIDLHIIELRNVKLVVSNHTPVVRRRIHREAWRKRTIRSDDQRVLTGTTLPGWHFAAHQELHVFHVLDRIDHFVAMIDALVV